MLTESFVASIHSSENVKTNLANKDAGIFLHDYQPLPSLKSSFKKSSTTPNCIAVSASHIFAAQADKAVVHVYSRDRGNQEAVVPFPEKISSLARVGPYNGAGTIALGTEGGRVLLWELCTGRLVSTPQSHLQATTCLAVDPVYNFLLTGSPDSNIHVWSIPSLLSFSQSSSHDPSQPSLYSPLRTLSNHRAAITALITGHSGGSTNIALSASQDNTCLVWDYHTGTLLRTFLFPSTPICLALDPADRAFYAGHDDGSIQLVDFYKHPSLLHPVYDQTLRATPTQPPPSDRWPLPAESSAAALCAETTYDGTILLSGHKNGKIHTWDTAKGRYRTQIADFSSSVTNLHMLPPTGFPFQSILASKILSVVKPRYEASLNNSGIFPMVYGVPENYSFSAQFLSPIPTPSAKSDLMLSFDRALSHPLFPQNLIDEGLTQLANSSSTTQHSFESALPNGDPEVEKEEIADLKAQLEHGRAIQLAYARKLTDFRNELVRRDDVDRRKRRMKRLRRMKREKMELGLRKREMGQMVEKEVGEMELDNMEEKEMAELSSTTDELTDSD